MFMSWNLYFANWKRTETMSLLIKIASLGDNYIDYVSYIGL